MSLRKNTSPLLNILLASIALTVPCAWAAPDDFAKLAPGAAIGDYVGDDVMIPMRDGVKLHAEIWRPKNTTGRLPILLQRSPYGYGSTKVARAFESELKELAKDGFILVLGDIRGRFGSEGEFVMERHIATKAGEADESMDAYDTIDWLVKNVADNNGKVGVFGISYMGWTTAEALIHPHPAIKAASIQASPEDMFLGDDYHHNGALRLDYGWKYSSSLETNGHTSQPFDFKDEDPYTWYLRQENLATMDQRLLGRTLPTWQNFVHHPNYDAYWRAGVTSADLPKKPSIPDLIVAGWWDQEDFYGPLKIYENQEKGDTEHHNFIVIGPWNHGGWRFAFDHYGPFPLGSETGTYFREQVELPWFKYWLKSEGELNQPEALIFETGSNQWKSYDSWPPKGVVKKELYFHSEGKLSFNPPAPSEAKPDSFVSDPANPVPYRDRPVLQSAVKANSWPLWLADDQAPFTKRSDVLTYQTDPLDSDVTIRGTVLAKLFAATTGTDADWVVKLIDVYPSDEATPEEVRGRHLIITDDVMRGRFRKSFEHPEAIAAGKVLDYGVDLHSASHVFQKGHRIEVQVQSSWFPLIDRNPQVFVPNILEARASDFKAQTHSIYHTNQYPSGVMVEVPPKEAVQAR